MKYLFLILTFVFSFIQISAQILPEVDSLTVDIILRDADTDEAIPFARVYLEGTSIETITNWDGNCRLTAPMEVFSTNDDLTIEYVGYETKHVNHIDFNSQGTVSMDVFLESAATIISCDAVWYSTISLLNSPEEFYHTFSSQPIIIKKDLFP